MISNLNSGGNSHANGKLLPQADRCALEIINQIRNGTLRPSQKLGEESVARKMHIGRAPVRIAFERLVSAGILTRVHRSGTFVRRIGLEEFCELMDVRAVLEGLAARLACERVTPAELAHLEKMAKEMDEMLPRLTSSPNPNWIEVLKLEADFHAEIARLSGNRMLPRMVTTSDLVIFCFQMGVSINLNDAHAKHIPKHLEVAQAIGSRNPEFAERIMRGHILVAKELQVFKLAGIRHYADGRVGSTDRISQAAIHSKTQQQTTAKQ
jgi:DNA-binding GntR family transcriptional regulator